MLQYQDMANYLQQQQQSGGTMAAVQPFNPISSTSLFGNSAFVNDYATMHTKPTAGTRYVLLIYSSLLGRKFHVCYCYSLQDLCQKFIVIYDLVIPKITIFFCILEFTYFEIKRLFFLNFLVAIHFLLVFRYK